MLLLIIRENGVRCKTYGCEAVNFGNMICLFWCFVIALTCSDCASADINLYPESNIYLPDGKNVQQPSRNWRYPGIPALEELETNGKKQGGLDYDLASPEDRSAASRRQSFDGILKFLGSQHSTNLNGAKTTPNFVQKLLDEVRPYPDADDYADEDDINQKWLNEDIERKILQQWRENSRKKIREELQNSYNEESTREDSESEGQPTENGVKLAFVPQDPKYTNEDSQSEVETTEDGVKLAFVPQDPKYYENMNEPIAVADTQPVSKPISLQDQTKSLISDDGTNPPKTIDVPFRRDQTTSSRTSPRYDLTSGRSSDVILQSKVGKHDATGVYIIAIIAGISAAATVGLIAVGIGWYNLQKHVKNASDVEYPAYGVTGPNKDVSPSNDKRLAQSAQMFHYQYQKQQMTAMERAATSDRNGSVSEMDSDEENEEGDYTVYECPGLAPTGEMEVKNPLYEDDPTPAQTPQVKQGNKE